MPPKPAYPPGNPEWVDILQTEARKQAERDPDSHAAKNLKKAAKSLIENPLPMTDPGQALELKFVGAKTVALLRKELRNRSSGVVDAADPLPSPSDPAPRKRKAASSTTTQSSNSRPPAAKQSLGGAASGAAFSGDFEREQSASKTLKRTHSAPAVQPEVNALPKASTSREELTAPPARSKSSDAARSSAVPQLPSQPVDAAELLNAPFGYFFIDDAGARTDNISLAETKLSADEHQLTLVRIEYRAAQAKHRDAQQVSHWQLQPERPGEAQTEHGFIPRTRVAKRAPGFDLAPVAITAAVVPPPAPAPASKPVLPRPSTSNPSTAPAKQKAITSSGTLGPLPSPAVSPAVFKPYDEDKLVVMRPGEYDVYLALDHRERATSSGLEQSMGGVPTKVLPLLLADAVWLAVRKTASANSEHDTIVLDGALERKRLDDLIASVQNKRYDDQKARMGQSGFTRFFYLLEHKGDSRLLETYEQQMWTVRSQTQIMDNFTILTAKSNAEAVQQHCMLTKSMTRAYKGKTLYGIQQAYTDRQSYLEQLSRLQKAHPTWDILPTYDCFQTVNAKQHTIKTGWAQMLYAQAGLSAEKTAALVERWPTAAAFWADLESHRSQLDPSAPAPVGRTGKPKKQVHPGETFFKEHCETGGTRDVGPALSRTLWDVWTQDAY